MLNSPVRPLLVQHTVTTLPASNRLAALQRNVLVAVTALVVDGARVDVDLLLGLGGAGAVVAAVLLCGHSERCVVDDGRRTSGRGSRWVFGC